METLHYSYSLFLLKVLQNVDGRLLILVRFLLLVNHTNNPRFWKWAKNHVACSSYIPRFVIIRMLLVVFHQLFRFYFLSPNLCLLVQVTISLGLYLDRQSTNCDKYNVSNKLYKKITLFMALSVYAPRI